MVAVTGCRQSLKHSWGNFRAYYNTYYNAEKNFKAGLKKVHDQPVSIDPTQPVRIHPAPVLAGKSDFQQAIDKGAKILRKFPTSKWADDALLLIGKSYYYRQEFYPALKKFEELRQAASSPQMVQQAIIWKGRTQLDLKAYDDAINYLESELNSYPEQWSEANKAEIRALLAEHFALSEQWEPAANYLTQAVSKIQGRELLGRSLFLYGQMLERLDRYGEAYFAYSRVSKNFPGFEYIYWARFKQADVARKEGNLDIALEIYQDLRKDDKNFKRRGELSFEIARTLEMKGQLAEAEARYKSLLYGQDNGAARDIRADIYYRLGKMYSEQYNDFSTAAAYFDSSSTIRQAPKEIEVSQDPQTLADAYGKYTRLQQTIHRADSLMHLASLSPAQLDSALERIRAQKRQQVLAKEQKKDRNTLANRNTVETNQKSASSSRYGFLNYRNANLVRQSKAEFQIVWGNRPLVDDWRRIQAVRQTGNDRSDSTDERQVSRNDDRAKTTAIELNLDDIPTSPEQKKALLSDKINAQYELGNLLFLNLNSPDSARYYFHRVIKSDVGGELRPKAMYSLYQLFKSQNNQDSLAYWRKRIVRQYPATRYARRVQPQDEEREDEQPDSLQQIRRQVQQIQDSNRTDKALRLRKLALANRSSELAPHIFYKAIEDYIRQAKAQDALADSLQAEVLQLSGNQAVRTDSAASDTLLQEPWQFRGAYWDSVRAAVQQFDTTFTEAPQHHKVTVLRKMLKQPEPSSALATCKQLGVTLTVQPSMQQFLDSVNYPDKVKDMALSGEVVYVFMVKSDGTMLSYELQSQRTSLGIEDAFEKAFDRSLKFAPLDGDNLPDKLRCEMAFPIQR